MNKTTENFLKIMREFQWPDPAPIFYRLYHDESGTPLIYTMEDLSGNNYIDISKEDFLLASMDSRVINGRLIPPTRTITTKLRPNVEGTCCHPSNVSIVVGSDQSNIKWGISSNGKN